MARFPRWRQRKNEAVTLANELPASRYPALPYVFSEVGSYRGRRSRSSRRCQSSCARRALNSIAGRGGEADCHTEADCHVWPNVSAQGRVSGQRGARRVPVGTVRATVVTAAIGRIHSAPGLAASVLGDADSCRPRGSKLRPSRALGSGYV